jgi:hypothetical protein
MQNEEMEERYQMKKIRRKERLCLLALKKAVMLDDLQQNLLFLDFPEDEQAALKHCYLNNTTSYPRIFNLHQQAVSLKLHAFILASIYSSHGC